MGSWVVYHAALCTKSFVVHAPLSRHTFWSGGGVGDRHGMYFVAVCVVESLVHRLMGADQG